MLGVRHPARLLVERPWMVGKPVRDPSGGLTRTRDPRLPSNETKQCLVSAPRGVPTPLADSQSSILGQYRKPFFAGCLGRAFFATRSPSAHASSAGHECPKDIQTSRDSFSLACQRTRGPVPHVFGWRSRGWLPGTVAPFSAAAQLPWARRLSTFRSTPLGVDSRRGARGFPVRAFRFPRMHRSSDPVLSELLKGIKRITPPDAAAP